MTAAAILFYADKVSICTDTRIYDDLGATVGHGTKAYPLGHLRSILFCRGKLTITVGTVARLMASPGLHDFEDAAEALGGIYREIASDWAERVGYDRTGQRLHEGALFGWSEREQRMRSVFHTSVDDFQPHREHDRNYGGPIAWPLLPAGDMPMARSSDTADAKLRAVLLAIDRYCVENPAIVGNARLGGEMALFEVTEREIAHRIIGTFSDFMPAVKPPTAADQKRAGKLRARKAARKNNRRQ